MSKSSGDLRPWWKACEDAASRERREIAEHERAGIFLLSKGHVMGDKIDAGKVQDYLAEYGTPALAPTSSSALAEHGAQLLREAAKRMKFVGKPPCYEAGKNAANILVGIAKEPDFLFAAASGSPTMEVLWTVWLGCLPSSDNDATTQTAYRPLGRPTMNAASSPQAKDKLKPAADPEHKEEFHD